MTITLFAGLLTGLMLGLFGSGGSIVTLPALMYLGGVETKSAIAMSLGIVGVTAAVSAGNHWRRGNVDLAVASVFALFGAFGTYLGARLGVVTPAIVQVGLFVIIMYAAAWRMFSQGTVEPKGGTVVRLDASGEATLLLLDVGRVGHIAVHGVVVGVLTGLVGVGGGFLIVPALVLLSGLPMKTAVGTSLLVVAAKSFAGFAGYVGAVSVDYTMMALFTAVAVGASFAGAMIAHRLSAHRLKQGFAVFLVLVATYMASAEFL